MVEDFVDVVRPRYEGDPNFMAMNFRTLTRVAPAQVVVWDTGTAGAVVTVSHPLGRTPSGVVVVNGHVEGAAAPVGWYRDTDDDPWTETEISLRFDVTGATVRLMVF